MGGIVARMMPLLANYRNGSITDIITLSTPHREVALPLQRNMYQLMKHVNSEWKTLHGKSESVLQDITLTSIAGGNRDTVLDSSMVGLDSFANDTLSRFYFTSSMPYIWTAGDHEASTWCNQLLEQLANLTFKLFQLPTTLSALDRMKTIEAILYPASKVGKHSDYTVEDLDVQVEYSRVQLVNVTTRIDETRRYMMLLPQSSQYQSYQLRMLTTLQPSQFDLHICQKVLLAFQCDSISSEPLLKPASNFTIRLWRITDSKSEQRPSYHSLDFSLNTTKLYGQFLFTLKPNVSGDFFATVDHKQTYTKTYNKWKPSFQVINKDYLELNGTRYKSRV